MRHGWYYPLWFGLISVIGYLLYARFSKLNMEVQVFAIEVVSDDVDIEMLARQINCKNDGPIGPLQHTYQFSYQGTLKNPLEWMRKQSKDIKWIDEQVPKIRYKRNDEL
jgi:hypothetical protein